MKRFSLIIAILAMSLGLKAQCGISEAVDFNTVDCHGNNVHLFDILDHGQYVLIDFFYCSCGPCQQATPKVVEAYSLLGCNMYDVFFMEISRYDNDAACQNWCQNYGVEYPTISTDGGSAGICSTYQIPAYPTLILIAPDRNIVIQDLWPISNAQTIVNQLANYGIQEHDCDAPQDCDAPTNLTADATNLSVHLSWTASETAISYNIYRNGELFTNITETEFIDEDVEILQSYSYTVTSVCGENLESDMSNEVNATIYEETLSFEIDNIEIEYGVLAWNKIYNYTQNETVTITRVTENMNELRFTLDGENFFNSNDEVTINIAQGESIDFGLICDITTKEIVNDTITFSSNAADAFFIAMVDNMWSIEENEQINIYPNPANDFVTLRGNNIDNVLVFNALGQMVDKYVVNANEVKIATNNYENGVYFIKVNESNTYRIVVTH